MNVILPVLVSVGGLCINGIGLAPGGQSAFNTVVRAKEISDCFSFGTSRRSVKITFACNVLPNVAAILFTFSPGSDAQKQWYQQVQKGIFRASLSSEHILTTENIFQGISLAERYHV